MSYRPRRPPQPFRLHARGLDFQLYRWPGADPHPVILIHGWGDAAPTWQFLADHLAADRSYVAMDLRGFGRTERPADGYWFPDYLGDLEALLDQLSPNGAVDLVGHSMGGNIALMYAGVRPERVRRVVNLESFGLPRTEPSAAPARYAQWLDELRAPATFADYEDYEQFIRVLARRNPRTTPERLEFIARAWARPVDGRIQLWADPKHKHVNPVLYQRDQAEACWRAIEARVLFVLGAHSEMTRRFGAGLSLEALQTIFRDVSLATIAEAGHMLHHEQPAAVAHVIDQFLAVSFAHSQ